MTTYEQLVAKYRNSQAQPARRALEGIERVDWPSLHHALGDASDVPALLRAALSCDARDGEFAFKLLHETIWHQGTIWEATEHVVPFLLRMLSSPETPDKASVAFLLARLVEGRSTESAWVQATRAAVGQGVRLLYPHLESEYAPVREHVAKALGFYQEYAAGTLPLLEKALSVEDDRYTREEMQLATDKLADG